MNTINRLSKSTFIRGLQCERSLYLYKHHYKLKDPTPSSLQVVFDQGTNVGILAQELFPNGVDASPENHFKMVESVGKTLDFISQGETTIYEATFLYDDVLAALDILVKDDEGWKAYEVKSSTKVLTRKSLSFNKLQGYAAALPIWSIFKIKKPEPVF